MLSSKFKKLVAILIVIVMLFSAVSCGKTADELLWDGATYKEDVTLGTGADTIYVTVTLGEKSVKITIKTDSDTLSGALTEHSLVNDPSFFDTANGIKADWNENQAWWKVCKGGEMTSVGITELEVTDGDEYELIYTIG